MDNGFDWRMGMELDWVYWFGSGLQDILGLIGWEMGLSLGLDGRMDEYVWKLDWIGYYF